MRCVVKAETLVMNVISFMSSPRTLKSTGNACGYGTELRLQAQDVADPEHSPNPIRKRKSMQKERNQLSRKPFFYSKQFHMDISITNSIYKKGFC